MNKITKVGLIVFLFSLVACQVEYQTQPLTNQSPAKVEQKEKPPLSAEEVANEKRHKQGKMLFLENCASCHNNNMKDAATASALGGITQRRSKEWLYKYVRNSEKMLKQKDPQALEIAKKNRFTMPAFTQLTDEDIDQIFLYVETKYTKDNPPID